jgi:hypothetical protein
MSTPTMHMNGVGLWIHLFLTLALAEASGQLHAPVNLLQGKNSVPIAQGAKWAPEPVGDFLFLRTEKFIVRARILTCDRPGRTLHV